MKKLLMLGSISLLLLEQVGYAGMSATDARRKKYSASSTSSSASKSTLALTKKAGGNANTLMAALGVKEEDLKDPWSRGVWGFSWKDESKYKFKTDDNGKEVLDSDGAKIKVELSAEELEDQKNLQIDRIMETYLAKYKAQPLVELQKDAQAFQEKFKDVKNTALQAKIASLVEIAQDAAQRIYAISIDEKIDEMLQGKSLSDALKQAQFELGIADAASKDLYKEVIQQLNIINTELEKLKRQHGTDTLDAAKKMLSVFDKNENYVQADVYRIIVSQLDVEQQDTMNLDNVADERIRKHAGNVIKAYEEAQAELKELHEKILKYRNYKNTSYNDDIKKLESKKNELEKVIVFLQLRKDDFELDVTRDVMKLLENNKRDAKKALETLKPAKSIMVNPFAKAKAEKVLTAKEQLMVKQLEAMIKQSAQQALENDPVAQAKARLASADFDNMLSDMKLIILSPFGMQDKEFDEETNAALEAKIQEASNQFKSVVLSKDSVQQKQKKEQAIMKKVGVEAGKLLAASTTGVSEEVLASSLKSGNVIQGGKEVAFDIAMNKLLTSFKS